MLLDDVNPTMKYHYNATSVAKYPSDAAYSAATRSALAYIGPRIQGAGRLAIANNAAWVEYYSTGVDWLRFLSGQMDEMFLKWGGAAGESYRGEAQWKTQLNELKETERQGKIFIGKTQSVNTDQAAARYGYATMLLGRESRAAYLFGDSTAETPLFPEYSLPIGIPVAPEERLATGVHRRAFSAGLVLVNPTAGTQSVSLGGSYSGSGVSGVSSVAMTPHTGLVLTKDGAPAPEPTPEPTPDPEPAPDPVPTPTPDAQADADPNGSAQGWQEAEAEGRARGGEQGLAPVVLGIAQVDPCRARTALPRHPGRAQPRRDAEALVRGPQRQGRQALSLPDRRARVPEWLAASADGLRARSRLEHPSSRSCTASGPPTRTDDRSRGSRGLPRQRQTRREAGAQSQGSHRDRPAAERNRPA